ncbi:MAG: AAA family ATPase [Patescibacteria group bacterium]
MDTGVQELQALTQKLQGVQIPQDLAARINNRIAQLAKLTTSPSFLPEIDSLQRYIDWIVNIPWTQKTTDILDLKRTQEVMDMHHFGLAEIKDHILEYVSIMKLKADKGEIGDIARAPILCFVGLVGTGKTTIAYSIAEAMGRKIERIPFGGMGDPLDLRGQSRMHPESEPGKIIKALRNAGSRNPVILLDEIDRVTDQGRASIMGVLVELLDPEQNKAFTDHYIDFPVNLSECLFIATANNTTNIATAVMDRIEPIVMPSYTDQEKITIAQKYMLPKTLKESGIPEGTITFDEDVWVNIARPLGYDAGIRTLERTLKGVVRKVARAMVEGKGNQFHITSQNVKEFLPQ